LRYQRRRSVIAKEYGNGNNQLAATAIAISCRYQHNSAASDQQIYYKDSNNQLAAKDYRHLAVSASVKRASGYCDSKRIFKWQQLTGSDSKRNISWSQHNSAASGHKNIILKITTINRWQR